MKGPQCWRSEQPSQEMKPGASG